MTGRKCSLNTLLQEERSRGVGVIELSRRDGGTSYVDRGCAGLSVPHSACGIGSEWVEVRYLGSGWCLMGCRNGDLVRLISTYCMDY